MHVDGIEIQCRLYVTVCMCQDWHVTCLLPRGELIHTSVDWCKFNLSLRHSANTLVVCHLVVLTPKKANNYNGTPKEKCRDENKKEHICI